MNPTETDAVAALAAQALTPSPLTLDHELPITAVVLRGDQKVHLIDSRDYDARPIRVEYNLNLYTVADFLAYVEKHRIGSETVNPWNPHIFLCRDSLMATCVFDHHEADLAARRKATCNHQLVWSKEIEPWRAIEGKGLSQIAFAEFIQDHELEFLKPLSSEMLTMASQFEATSSARFSSKHNLTTGEIDLSYKLENQEQGTVKVPDVFTIGVPVFKGGPVYELAVRLRYRVRDNAVTFSFKFKNLDRVVDDAWKAVVTQIRAADLAPVFEVA